MDHHATEPERDIQLYLQRDLLKREIPAYQIVRHDIVGRHMVASRDIKPGEVIFREEPLTFGPSDNSKPVCLGCYKRILDKNCYTCKSCGFPMCNKKCSQIAEHKDFECAALLNKGFKVDATTLNYEGEESAYSVVSPIRAMLMKTKDARIWNLIWNHMSHDAARKKSTFWTEKTKNVIKRLKEMTTLLVNEAIERDVEILLGILLVNDFEVSPGGDKADDEKEEDVSIRALFGLASMPNHSCVANATHDFASRESGFVMTMRATMRIGKGQDIHHAYTEPLDPLLVRRSLLQVGKFFRCDCPRCSDPTELGTMTSAVKCRQCKTGFVIPENVTDIESDWKCIKCGDKMKCQKVNRIYRDLKAEAEKLDPTKATIEQIENFVKSGLKTVHENHVLILDKKYHLAKMYGRMSGFQADSMTEEQFNRKLALCKDVLSVLDKIMPGRTRKRGMMLYEMHLPLVMLANRALQKGPNSPGVDPKRIKQDLKSGLFSLRMGLEILGDEPEGSFERKIVDGSKESVAQLEEWVKTVSSNI